MRYRALSPPAPVPPGLAARVGFTNHAIKRFAERGGLLTADRVLLEPLLRDLIRHEAVLVSKRPPWARSRSTADLLLQVGEWLLLPAQRDPIRAGHYAVVTVISRKDGMTWRRAWRHGCVRTLPPDGLTRAGRVRWLPRVWSRAHDRR